MGSCSWPPTVGGRSAIVATWVGEIEGTEERLKRRAFDLFGIVAHREEELASTKESVSLIKNALEQGLKDMESARTMVTSQLVEAPGSRREETWVEALQRIRSQGQHAESRLTKSAEFGHMSDPLTGGGRI